MQQFIVILSQKLITICKNTNYYRDPGGSMSQVVGSNNSYKPITNTAWVRVRLCKLQKGCTRLAAASDKVYQLLAHGRWFSPASSTTKTGRHDTADILLKVALKHQNINSNQSNYYINNEHSQFAVDKSTVLSLEVVILQFP